MTVNKILFEDFPYRILVVSANGGAPHQLMPADHPEFIGAGAWLPDGSSIIFGRHMGCPLPDGSCVAIYRLDLKTQQVSKIPGSDGLLSLRLSRDGHYLTAISKRSQSQHKVMLYNFQTQRWSELAKGSGGIAWSHDGRFVYLNHGARPAELSRISVPDGKVQSVLDLKGVTLGGLWPDWISLLSDDSPLLMTVVEKERQSCLNCSKVRPEIRSQLESACGHALHCPRLVNRTISDSPLLTAA